MSAGDTRAPLLEGVAIVGMAGRFPGAANVAEFWANQLAGVEGVSHFTPEELEVSNAADLSGLPNYIRSRGIVRDVEMFDAEFFGIYPREAEMMDPQQRIFLECCWEAFEDAGYDPYALEGAAGVFAGSSVSTYFLSKLCARPGFIPQFTGEYQVGNYQAMMGNNLDFLATRVAYKFNLRGPAFTMQAGCSTSLLAVCQACQSLLTYQSDMALAGGVSITLPQKRGYLYQEGGMVSADGHCRTFDADAQGTVFGSGCAVVLLKRAEDAVRDGDHIYAVIRGFGVNNDGSAKVGYTAPSVEGQARVIALAQEAAGIDPATIGYVEAHGTATPLGDPIELAALAQAFRARTAARHFCAVGTAKTNVGHLDIAAGVTGLIHASKIVQSGEFPPTLHFQKPNTQFDLESSPFYINRARTQWRTNGGPRRAGVSAFGVGGTNAHVVLEQAPPEQSSESARPAQTLVLSARSPNAIERATANLKEYLARNADVPLADVAWTLQAGRKAFGCRRAIVARDAASAIAAMDSRDARRVQTRTEPLAAADVYFLFPGQGSQHPGMGREIYESEPVFRQWVDRCAEILRPYLGEDLRALLYPANGVSEEARRRVTDTIIAQPAIFTIEYALAQLWISRGIRPKAMIGHSIGEFVAACLAGVFSLEDALRIVAERGRLMQALASGGMLSVRLPEADVLARLANEPQLDLAAVNGPSLCVVSGPHEALDAFEVRLASENVAAKKLVTSHAFHSKMMEPILGAFTKCVRSVSLHAPKLPYVSGVTGKWITPEEATSAEYWAQHFRKPVQFAAAAAELLKTASGILLEVGPGSVLGTLVRQQKISAKQFAVVASLSDGFAGEGDAERLAMALGELWLAGTPPDWRAVHAGESRRRVPLPTYPFERKRYWLETPAAESAAMTGPLAGATAPSTELTEEPRNVNATTQTPAVAPSAPRAQRIRAVLAEIFEDLSGVDVSEAGPSATFLEMGFDSLFLTQVTQALRAKFNLRITFRQLLGDLATLDALAAYLDKEMPADMMQKAPAAPPVAATSPAVALPAALPVAATQMAEHGGASPLEKLLRDQLQAMNQLFAQQLAALQGAGLRSAEQTAQAVPAGPAAAVSPAKPQSAGAEGKELKGYTPFKPLQRSISGELTPRQQQYVRALIERYVRKTPGSKAKTQEYRSVLADPRVVTGFRAQWKEMIYPIITVKSQGSHLWDVDGNEYVDILNGFGPIMLGHRPEFVERAIEKQLHEGFEIGPQTLLAGEVAQALCQMTGNERATFCNTGSEAVTAAMRVARTVTGRSKVVFFAGDYHGMFDEVLVKGFQKAGEPHAVPIAPGIPREKAANVVVLEYGTPESLEWIRKHAGELAAVMVEPVQSRHPGLQPVSFLKELRRITEQAGACLIFDEVVTGFRVHPGGCQALFDIRADLATYGKVLAGGMPIGVLAGKAKYMDALDGGMWQFGDDSYPEAGVTFFAGTFVRHPLAMAACAAVLRYLKEQGPALQQQLDQRTAGLVTRLNALLAKNAVPTHIEHFGSIFYFSFPADFRFGSLFYYHLREKGIHVLEGFPCFLTTEHSDADRERIVRAFEETIAEMQAGDALPAPGETTMAPRVSEPAVVAAAVTEAPVTESQLEILLSAQLGPEANCCYNESFSLHLRGPLNEPALRTSLSELLARHDSLRATFSAEGGKQFFAASLPLDLPLADLSASDARERESRFAAIIAEDAATPFDLAKGPLVRMQLIRLAADHHIVLFTSHHAVCDGWSTNVLLDELSRLYNANSAGRKAELDPLMPFSQYAYAQEAHFRGPEGAENEAYWKKKFAVLPPLLNLPGDRPHPAVKDFSGATYRTEIGAEAYKTIKRAGAQQKCTLFVTLLAGFEALLSRLSGQDDIVVGIPAAGQSLVEGVNLTGHCVNFVPVRGDLSGEISASQFLAQVRQSLLDAYDHQNYTYGRLVRQLSVPRDPGRLPLMEVQFNLEKIASGLAFDGLAVEADPNPKSFVNFDLFLNVMEGPDGLTLDLDYNTGLLDEATVARWMVSYEVLLLGMAQDASRRVSMLPVLTAEERRRVLFDCNQTAAPYPAHKGVHQLFEEQAARTPEAVALEFEGERLTYAQLDARANQLARHLMRIGVQPGDLVGLYLERSMEMVVGLLGAWKAGASYLPLDPGFPRERLAFVFEETALPVLLTQARLVADLPQTDARFVCLDRDRPLLDRESPASPNVAADPARVAYTIYTSGSTGKPKGVEVTHRNFCNLLTFAAKRLGMSPDDVLVAVSTISFDIAGADVFLPLTTGGRLIIASRAIASDGQRLLQLLADSRATVLQATPVTFRMLLEAGWAGQPKFTALSTGEALPRELANRILDCNVPLWNMYGPTETTIWSAVNQITRCEGPVPVGPPIANTQFYVLDANGEPAPDGVTGELFIGGAGVARGYYKHAELTAERFVADRFSDVPGARMYRTGDLVRRLPDGQFEFFGRMDGQVKLRGYRIELGEIEYVLARHPAVREAVVLLREDVPGEKRLVAYLTPNPGGTPAAGELRAFLSAKLPDYMIPAAFVTVPQMPLTPNGKVNRRALPVPDWAKPAGGAGYVAPRTEDERKLATVCAEVLRLERVGAGDNLFELGADSLHVFQIVARASKAGISVTPRQILQFRTITAILAEAAKAASDTPGAASPGPVLAPVARSKYRLVRHPT